MRRRRGLQSGKLKLRGVLKLFHTCAYMARNRRAAQTKLFGDLFLLFAAKVMLGHTVLLHRRKLCADDRLGKPLHPEAAVSVSLRYLMAERVA